jgi:Ca2+-binding RTX toxin-like protein
MTTVVGTAGDDTLSGTEEKDRIWGLTGADEIEAGGGDMTGSTAAREMISSA